MDNTDLGNWQCKILTKSMTLLVTGSWVNFLYQSWFYFHEMGLKYKQTVLGGHGNIRVTIHNNTWSSICLTHFGVMHVHPPEFKGFVTLTYSFIPCKSIAVLTIIFFKVLKQTQRVLDLFSLSCDRLRLSTFCRPTKEGRTREMHRRNLYLTYLWMYIWLIA